MKRHAEYQSSRPQKKCATFAASGSDVKWAVINRKGSQKTVKIDYPKNRPTSDTDRLFASQEWTLVCPGCSEQDIQLGRCHSSILSRHIKACYPNADPPVCKGMQLVFPPEKIVDLIDSKNAVFVGRRPPRGVPTKQVGAKTTLHRSIYANPFIVAKESFKLGESLELYEKWINAGYCPLSDDEIQKTVDEAKYIPESIEEMLRVRPDLFA